ncbi:hypothetical protein F0562_032856 [Nyssa sinensis]|uniref:Glycine-rich protein n=1 Tax=Nyssa sinensis TaxID=561372 RepID=A0A5J5AUD0_9ASTE|nr:hypothetical protein F0562_032856 [Nyssa sinensis]
MAATAASDVADGPVLSLINKRLRGLRKKYNRILQLEESIAQGKPIHKEQEEVLHSKPSVSASIDELEKLREPLSAAIAEEINLAVQRHQVSASPSLTGAESAVTEDDNGKEKEQTMDDIEHQTNREHAVVEDLLNVLYFGSMFDVKSQSDFTSTMLTRTHERGCCLTYDYVTDDDATDLLGERDLDLISMLGSLLISRPVDSSLSHKNALQRCIEHAKLWLTNSDQPIDSDSNVTYAGLRARLNKIMASDYFTTTPEMKAPVEVVAAAAAGNYASFQVPVHGSIMPVNVPVQVEGSGEEYQPKLQPRLQLLLLRPAAPTGHFPQVCRLLLLHSCLSLLLSFPLFLPQQLHQILPIHPVLAAACNCLSLCSSRTKTQQIIKEMRITMTNLVLWKNFRRCYIYHLHKLYVVPFFFFFVFVNLIKKRKPVALQGELEVENPAEVQPETEPFKSQGEMGQNQREVEPKEQHYVPRRTYQNQRGVRGGGGRRGYPNGRGGRSVGRGGGAYQNGRNQYYDQPGNYYSRNYYNNRGRGGRGGANSYNHHGSGGQAGHAPTES